MSLARWVLFFKRKIQLPSRREVANRTSETFIAYLRSKGVQIGEGCEFFKPETQFVDPSNPELIRLGRNVKVSLEVAILTHGFDYSVLRELHPGEGFGSAGPVIIGDNVFIGMRAMLLKDTTIGNNCVIGAGSVVRGVVPDNSVVAGNPAHLIMTIDELYRRYKAREVSEAQAFARILYLRRGTPPTLADFTEHFYLFAGVEEAERAGIDVKRQTTPAYYDIFKTRHSQLFPSFAAFLESCGIPEKG